MRIANMVRTWPRALFRRNRVEEDLDEELRYHVERDTEESIRAGMTPETARLQVIRSLEGIERRNVPLVATLPFLGRERHHWRRQGK